MPLQLVRPGEYVEILRIRGGERLRRRLAEMGLIAGTPVRVISNGRPGPAVLEIKGSRLAIGHGVAHKIHVKQCERAAAQT
jgi:Fe2+ transport system protein FeoA